MTNQSAGPTISEVPRYSSSQPMSSSLWQSVPQPLRQAAIIPSLYGLRALSIVLVILSHCFLHARPANTVTMLLLALAGNGSVGVSVFFLISGFLITTLLLKEEVRSGRIDLPDFYLRRAFRILPAFLLYISVIAALQAFGVLSVPSAQFWHALTFTMDYVPDKNWFLGHVWSLSVEEQFYLVWPLLVVLCSRRMLASLAASVILLGPFIRMADRALFPGTRFEIEYMGHTRADMLMFGCLIAVYFKHQQLHALLKKANAFWVPALSALFLFVLSPMLELRFGGLYIKTVGYTLQGLCISFIMLYLITRPCSTFGKIFNSKVAIHVGAISYSLYLWQELFIGFRQFGWSQTILRLIAAFIAAEGSYFLVETPMLNVKRRFVSERITVPPIHQIVSNQAVLDA